MFLCPPIFRINAYYWYDHLGNTRVVYNVNLTDTYNLTGGVIINLENVQDYYPYGKTLRKFTGSNSQERFLTTQHERDEKTGLDYRGARFYDAEVGRFLSLDPLAADYPSLSDYVYVMDNPLIFIDPTGKSSESGYTLFVDGMKVSGDVEIRSLGKSSTSEPDQRGAVGRDNLIKILKDAAVKDLLGLKEFYGGY